MADKGDCDDRPRADWPDLPQADPDFASANPQPPPPVPGPPAPEVDTGSPVQPGLPFDAEVEAGIERLLAYLAEPRPPLTIGELAEAVGVAPLAVGAAILELRDRERLMVAVQPRLRFVLRVA